MQPQHLKAPKQKTKLGYIIKFLVKVTYLLTRMFALQNTVYLEVGNSFSQKIEQQQKGSKDS